MKAMIPKAMLLTAMCLALAACGGGGGGGSAPEIEMTPEGGGDITPETGGGGDMTPEGDGGMTGNEGDGGMTGNEGDGGTSQRTPTPTPLPPPEDCQSAECKIIESSIAKIEDGEDKSATEQYADVVNRIQKDDSDLTEDEKDHLLSEAQQKLNEESGATGAIARLFGNDLGVTKCVRAGGENCAQYAGKPYPPEDSTSGGTDSTSSDTENTDSTSGGNGNSGSTEDNDEGGTDPLVTLANTVFGYGEWAIIVTDLDIGDNVRAALNERYALPSFTGTDENNSATYTGDATGVAGKDGSQDTTSFDARVELTLISGALDGDIIFPEMGNLKDSPWSDLTHIGLGSDKATSGIGKTATGKWDFLAYGTDDNTAGPDGFLGAFFIRETGGGGDDFLTGGFDAKRSSSD